MNFNKKNIFAIILSLLFLYLVFQGIDIRRLLDTFSIFDYKILFMIVPLILVSMIIRGYRWKALINRSENISISDLTEIIMAGNTLNIYLPARAGDFFRAYFLGEKHNKPKMEILASIVIERIIDGLTVLFLLFSAICLYYKTEWAFKIAGSAALFFSAGIFFIHFLLKYNKIDYLTCKTKQIFSNLPKVFASKMIYITEKIRIWINTFIDGISNSLDKKKISQAGLLSLIIWLIECTIVYILILGFGITIHFSSALFVIGFIALASIIPSSSIYIGPFQYAFILALSIYNIDKSSALAISFMLQMINVFVLTISFIIFVIKNNLNILILKKTNMLGSINE